MLIDLHAHPDIKLFYFHSGREWEGGFDVMWRIPRWLTGGFMPITMRTRIDNMCRMGPGGKLQRNVLAMACTWSTLEPIMRVQERSTWGAWTMEQAYPAAVERMRSTTPYALACQVLGETRRHAEHTLMPGTTLAPLVFTEDARELEAIIDRGRIALYHAIEGGICLYDTRPLEDGTFADEGWPAYADRIRHLRSLGVRQLCTSHHFDTHFVPQCENTQLPFQPSDNRSPVRYRGSRRLFHDPPGYAPKLVELCCDLGILVDLVHATPEARWEAMKICKAKNRPALISHGCVRGPEDRYQPHPYACSDSELVMLHDIGGVLALISSNCRLAYRNRERGQDRGLQYIVDTIRYIRECTGDVSIAAIGTDHDGGNEPMDDCRDPKDFPRVARALHEADFSQQEIDAILVGNAIRLFHAGWSDR